MTTTKVDPTVEAGQRLAEALRALIASAVRSSPNRPQPPASQNQGDGRPAMHVELTPRDREVLGLLARGLASKQIASRLHVSERTAKNYVAAAMWRLNAQNRAHAVAIAFRLGLIAPTLDDLLSA